MSTCPCNCGGAVKPGKKFAARGCSLRSSVISRDQRVATTMRWMETYTPEQRAEWSGKGGRNSETARWAALLEKWQDMSPREALHQAFWDGYRRGYSAKRRHEGTRMQRVTERVA